MKKSIFLILIFILFIGCKPQPLLTEEQLLNTEAKDYQTKIYNEPKKAILSSIGRMMQRLYFSFETADDKNGIYSGYISAYSVASQIIIKVKEIDIHHTSVTVYQQIRENNITKPEVLSDKKHFDIFFSLLDSTIDEQKKNE